MTRQGASGGILAPGGEVLRGDWYAVGLHSGAIKAAYGIGGLMEAGVSLPDLFESPGSEEWKSGTFGFVKMAWYRGSGAWWSPRVALGGEDSLRMEAESFYVAASWAGRLGGWPVEATLGGGTGRFRSAPFAGFGVIPSTFFGSTLKFITEYAGNELDFGARLALARDLRLDFVMLVDAFGYRTQGGKKVTVRMNRGLLGASRVGPVEWRKLRDVILLKRDKKKRPGR